MTPISAKGLQSLIPLLAGLGTVVQVLVLLALAFASIVCWAIIVQRCAYCRKPGVIMPIFSMCSARAMIWLLLPPPPAVLRSRLWAHLFRVAQQYVEVPVPVNGRRVAMDSELVPLSEATLERLRQTLRPRQAEELDHLEQDFPFWLPQRA